MDRASTAEAFTFDPNYEIDVNDERYWAEVLAAYEQIERDRAAQIRTEYQS